ncbi:MAG TPA: hypothetical protein VK184_22810 [Nostocaceae cyanobacterium]|nr:hypothetical protein [Nostocaceae cyanobacterium]
MFPLQNYILICIQFAVQKLLDDQAIAILAKIQQSERSQNQIPSSSGQSDPSGFYYFLQST